jgi:glycosyltransferase involved in cell wall biosynthesis
MNAQVTISVVIPNYNHSRTLPKSICSVINQTPNVDEVIIVDDCSTDDSHKIAKDFQNRYSQIRVISNKNNLGVMGALNVGLREVSSEYVLFLSSNDYLLDGIIGSARESLLKIKAGLWSALIYKEVDQKRKLYPSPIVLKNEGYISPKKCISYLNSVGSWFTGTTMLFRTEVLKELGGFEEKYYGFADMYAAMIIASKHGAYFKPTPYGVASVHENSVLHNTLLDEELLHKTIYIMVENGKANNKELFSNAFIDKFSRRIKYSGEVQRIKFKKLRSLIMTLLFIKLRIKEIAPFVYYRFLMKSYRDK